MSTPDGKFFAWWESYLVREGFEKAYHPFADLNRLSGARGKIRGILGMDIPHLQWRHVVAVDELGIIDPSSGVPDHISIQEYVFGRSPQGIIFDDEFLAVWKGARALRSLNSSL
jgi:hypothetical protein